MRGERRLDVSKARLLVLGRKGVDEVLRKGLGLSDPVSKLLWGRLESTPGTAKRGPRQRFH